jgi:hypothetical protein
MLLVRQREVLLTMAEGRTTLDNALFCRKQVLSIIVVFVMAVSTQNVIAIGLGKSRTFEIDVAKLTQGSLEEKHMDDKLQLFICSLYIQNIFYSYIFMSLRFSTHSHLSSIRRAQTSEGIGTLPPVDRPIQHRRYYLYVSTTIA